MRIADIITEAVEPPSLELLDAVRCYVLGGMGYGRSLDRPAVRKHAAVLEAALRPLAGTHTLYRGIHLASRAALKPESDFFARGTISMPGFPSGSMDQHVAENDFLYGGDEGLFVCFIIETMPGARGLVVEDYAEYLGGGPQDPDIAARMAKVGATDQNVIELMQRETEMVLSTKSRFKVDGIEHTPDSDPDGGIEDISVFLTQTAG